MNFKKFLPKESFGDSEEYYWSLIIEPGWVTAGIWRIFENSTQVIASSNSCPWQEDPELVDAADSALSSAIQKFKPQEREPSKAVFGFPSSWISGDQIKEEYLEKVKSLCSELSLTPIGFVVISEAIAHFIKSQEGGAVNAVIIGVYKDNIEISVFKFGNLVGTSNVARSVSLADDLIEGLSRFVGVDLPSRFVLYNGKEGELEEARQMILNVKWEEQDKLKFFHTPKVEIIDPINKVSAVSLAGAAEIGKATSISLAKENFPEEASVGVDETAKPKEDEEEEKVSPQEMGFVLEKDVSVSQAKEEEVSQLPPSPDYLQVDEFSSSKTQIDTSVSNSKVSSYLVGVINAIKRRLKEGILQVLSFPINLFRGPVKTPIFYGFLTLFIFMALGFLFWWFYPKAEITIYVAPRSLKEEIDIIVSNTQDLSQNSEALVVGGRIEEVEVSGERTRETTGTKTVGEKAKGEVTFYRVGPELTLPTGTIIHGPDDLDFILDTTLTVASGSASSPGTAKGPVTAEDIGAQYNLASGTSFSVANFSTNDVEAKNENAFSGGSSREISAVSEKDRELLSKELEDELLDKAKQEFLKKLSSDEFFIEESISVSSSSEEFSNKVGDEATSLKLLLTLKVKGVFVKKEDLVRVSQEKLSEKLPEGFVLKSEQMNFSFDVKTMKDNLYQYKLKVSANLLPKVDTDKVVERVRGRYIDVAEETLEKEVPGFVRAEIRIRPTFPGRLKTLPHVAKNIEVELTAENQ